MFGVDRNVIDLLQDIRAQSGAQKSKEPLPMAACREDIALQNTKSDQRLHQTMISTTDFFDRKTLSSPSKLESLRPIKIADLKVNEVCHSGVLFCRVAARATFLNSIANLVEDADGQLSWISVYNVPGVKHQVDAMSYLAEHRCIAIKEPFFKVRGDGTLGIRVDDPSDIVLDAQVPSAFARDGASTVEIRIAELLRHDPDLGQKRIREVLQAEGFCISQKRLRHLLGQLRSETQASGLECSVVGEQTEEQTVSSETAKEVEPVRVGQMPSESRPVHPKSFQLPARTLDCNICYSDTDIIKSRDAGNDAFKECDYATAEVEYTVAIKLAKKKERVAAASPSICDGVALWTLFSNRSAARLQLGRPDEALVDALSAHTCAPRDASKPILRCAEAMALLGLHSDLNSMLDNAACSFPEDADKFTNKQKQLEPRQTLRVGKRQQYKSISDAVDAAASGAEILVEAGSYCEPLLLDKPLTIRAFGVMQPDEHWVYGSPTDQVVEIWVKTLHTILIKISTGSVCLEGLRIVCEGPIKSSWNALVVMDGVAVVRNCSISGTSGPIVAVTNHARLIMNHCAVHDGAQGGLLAHDGTLVLAHVYCTRAAATGLEVRQAGKAVLNSCAFFKNGKQGILIFHGAGSFSATDSEIHSHEAESGVLVEETRNGRADFKRCKFYGNVVAGIVSQSGGNINVDHCEVHNNSDGILIQNSGSAVVRHCEVANNRSSGIFVGFDHTASAKLCNNRIHDNNMHGIKLRGRGKQIVSDNEEWNNGLTGDKSSDWVRFQIEQKSYARWDNWNNQLYQHQLDLDMRRWAKASNKHGNATREQNLCSGDGSTFSKDLDGISKNVDEMWSARLNSLLLCSYCKKVPDANAKFQKCQTCKLVCYCSEKCQRDHWKTGHKNECQKAPARYPSFVDNHQSVDDVPLGAKLDRLEEACTQQ